ncbi:MAG: HNH endonuclease [Deltaproteobacteria bacterium]|nr:HNH endonuclease [Deltaproteobacteria bacterium]
MSGDSAEDPPRRPEDDWSDFFAFAPAGDEHVRREKAKAREVRQSQWWKRRRSSGLCHYCGRHFPPRDLTMDHVVPLVRGGRTVKSNLVPCCAECNAKKRYLLPLEWNEYLERLDAEGSDRSPEAAPTPPPGGAPEGESEKNR